MIARKPGCYFLSRPRRFGKSLFLGALSELLEGNRELFSGLWIDGSKAGYDFKKYPVVKLNMAGDCKSAEVLENNITGKLRHIFKKNGLTAPASATPGVMLDDLVRSLKSTTGTSVAVLIDEYDAPIQGVISNLAQADKNRAVLHDFYSSLKALSDDDQTHVVFVTGITQFTQTSLFTVFNNLSDLTLKSKFNAVCGFTEEEFDKYITPYLPAVLEHNKSNDFLPQATSLDDLKKMIIGFYDGYTWNGKENILNPFSLVSMLDEKELQSYWFETATPTFFLDLLKQQKMLDFPHNPEMKRNELAKVDIKKLKLAPLMFQAGYLTIKNRIGAKAYRLTRPNKEVDEALNEDLLGYLLGQEEESIAKLREDVRNSLEGFDSDGLAACFRKILLWNTHVELRALEGSFQGLVGSVLKALNFSVTNQSTESEGVMDFLITLGKRVAFICEFKHEPFNPDIQKMSTEQIDAKRQELLSGGITAAKKQIADRRCDAKYCQEYETVKKMAVSFVGKADVAIEIY
jgi:hypothetical protein